MKRMNEQMKNLINRNHKHSKRNLRTEEYTDKTEKLNRNPQKQIE